MAQRLRLGALLAVVALAAGKPVEQQQLAEIGPDSDADRISPGQCEEQCAQHVCTRGFQAIGVNGNWVFDGETDTEKGKWAWKNGCRCECVHTPEMKAKCNAACNGYGCPKGFTPKANQNSCQCKCMKDSPAKIAKCAVACNGVGCPEGFATQPDEDCKCKCVKASVATAKEKGVALTTSRTKKRRERFGDQ